MAYFQPTNLLSIITIHTKCGISHYSIDQNTSRKKKYELVNVMIVRKMTIRGHEIENGKKMCCGQ